MEIAASTIKAYREHLQLSQRDFAEQLGLSQGLISLVEIGRNQVSRRLLRSLRIKSDEGVLKPTFAEFLAQGGIEPPAAETEFKVMRALPLETWNPRVDLRKPADTGAPGRFFLSGMPDNSRAYQFLPPPALLDGDSVAVFRPAKLGELLRDQVVLVQFKSKSAPDDLPAGVAHLGRVVVTHRKRVTSIQFESVLPNVPVVTLQEDALDAIMVCIFRGRYSM